MDQANMDVRRQVETEKTSTTADSGNCAGRPGSSIPTQDLAELSKTRPKTKWALRAGPIEVTGRIGRLLLRTLAIGVVITACAGSVRLETKIKAEISMALTIGEMP